VFVVVNLMWAFQFSREDRHRAVDPDADTRAAEDRSIAFAGIRRKPKKANLSAA
jgi:hypothetical protein